VEFTNTFVVDLPVEQTWELLTDVERVVPCLPGAALVRAAGDEFDASVKIKVGPISANYTGTGTWVERDAVAHRAVIRATGKDVAGQGGADATVTLTLREQGTGTAASVLTDLALSGRVAQFGRGVVADVSNKMLFQFVANLKEIVRHTGTPPTAVNVPVEVEPFNVGSAVGPLVMKYALPIVGAAVSCLVGSWLLRARRAGERGDAPRTPWARTGEKRAGAPIVIQLVLAPVDRRVSMPSFLADLVEDSQ
jgi:carbon monoxide dehydrogenase subunit G